MNKKEMLLGIGDDCFVLARIYDDKSHLKWCQFESDNELKCEINHDKDIYEKIISKDILNQIEALETIKQIFVEKEYHTAGIEEKDGIGLIILDKLNYYIERVKNGKIIL